VWNVILNAGESHPDRRKGFLQPVMYIRRYEMLALAEVEEEWEHN
jgi:hypothetical protein